VNNSRYKNDDKIKKEGYFKNKLIIIVFVSEEILDELKKMILESDILNMVNIIMLIKDDKAWPLPGIIT
jgi:hypothetical protein